jgi:hypothetical protein
MRLGKTRSELDIDDVRCDKVRGGYGLDFVRQGKRWIQMRLATTWEEVDIDEVRYDKVRGGY